MADGPDAGVPNAKQFRAWLLSVLEILEVSAHRLGETSGIGANTTKKFVSGVRVDVRLNTASRLVKGAQQLALQTNKDLPPLPKGVELDV